MAAIGAHVIADGAVQVMFPGAGYPGEPPLIAGLRIDCDEAVEVTPDVYGRIAAVLAECVKPAPGIARLTRWRTPGEVAASDGRGLT